MCDLGEISVSGSNEPSFETRDDLNEEMESTGEINGQTRRITVLRETGKFIPPVSQISLNGRSLCKRTTKLVSKTGALLPLGPNGSVEVHVIVNWGGKEDTKFRGGVKAEVSDDEGNYATVKIEQNSDGEGSAEVSAGHKKE